MNVWVEDDDVFFYLCRSGSFDENNTLLKQGRFRIRLTPNPFAGRSVPSCGACGGGNQGSDLYACQL